MLWRAAPPGRVVWPGRGGRYLAAPPPAPVPPGLSVVTAPGLGPLFDRLAETLEAAPLPPLQRETVVVSRNAGLRAWLTHALAGRLGCAASLDLPAVVGLVDRLAGTRQGDQPFEAGPLAWRLAPLLEDLGDDAVYAPLRSYLDKTGQTMPLASRLARLFDDYQVYRPDVLAAWERGGDPVPPFAHGPWQAALWRALLADGLEHRGLLLDRLRAQLARPEPRLTLPPRISVFGGLVLPPVYARMLGALARHVPVTVYAVTPGDVPTTEPHAHPLLRALAGRTRDFWHVQEELAAPPPERLTTPPARRGRGGSSSPPGQEGLGVVDGAGADAALDSGKQGGGSPLPPAGGGREGGDRPTTPPPPDQKGRGGAGRAPYLSPRRIGDLVGGDGSAADHPALAGPPSLSPPVQEGDSSTTAPPPASGRGGVVPLPSATALGQLRAALGADAPPAAPVPLDPADRSVRVHDCHSARRELEALRDALLDAFAEVPGLRPSDVLVLVPDLATYAPLVDAVFEAESATGDTGGAALRLPVHVVNHPHAPALRVVEAFRKALRMHDGRVTASELLDLLGYPIVRQAAGIAEDELPRLRAWVREAGVCWGLTAERKGRFGLPADDLHTWRYGLDRLLLGVMTGGAEGGAASLVLGHAACDAAGLDGADLLGRFCEWAEALFSALWAIDRPAPLAEWPGHLLRFLDGVFAAEAEEEVEAVVFLRGLAADLAGLDELAASPGAEVPFRTVRAHLDGAAGSFEQREPVLTGRVTFADPLVLRHAPFRVVAFLGLGDGVWPRPETPAGFDLLAQHPHPGDASPRATEKQLFVDAVLACSDRLVLSYVGRSEKDNAERAASVCLDAFLDACDLHWGPEARERLVVRHRLQPFAETYFDRARPTSYAGQHLVARAATAPPRPYHDGGPLPDEDDAGEVTLADLAAAWTNPSQFALRRRLRVSLDLEEDAVRDDEPVTLGGLERWRVREAVVEGALAGLSDDDLAALLLRGGLLPGGAPGAALLRRVRAEATPVVEAVRAWGPTEPRAVDVEVAGARVVGTVPHLGERGALRYRAGAVRAKHLVASWVDHLALCAGGGAARSCAVGVEGTAHFEPVPTADAQAVLGALVRGYHQARAGRLPVYERASHAYAGKLSKRDLADYAGRVVEGRSARAFRPATGAVVAARKAFDPWGDARGDKDDAYVALATRGGDPFAREEPFAKWSLALWAPLLHHRRDGVPP